MYTYRGRASASASGHSDMAFCACVVILLIAAYTPSLLASPSQEPRRLSDGRLDKQNEANATSSHEELAFRRHQQPQQLDPLQRNYPPLHNNFNNVRRRHRRRKLVNGMRRPSTRRSETSDQPLSPNRNKDSEVAIILAKLNPGADGTPSAVRPYRLEAGGRDLTPLHDDSDETLNDILHALKLQVAGREKVNDLQRRILVNATAPVDSLELGEKLGTPSEQPKANDSVEVKQKEPLFTSLENLAEAYTEPTYESVIQSRADDDAFMAKTPSTLPSEYFYDNNNDEPRSKLNLQNYKIVPFKDDPKSSIKSKVAFGFEPITSEPPDTGTNADDEVQLVIADMLEPESTPCSKTEDGSLEPCLGYIAPTQADSQCDACNEDASQCDACRDGGSKCEACKQADKDDVPTSPSGTCPALPILAGRNAGEQLEDQKDEIEDDPLKKDVGLRINRKSYKISIIFQ